MAEADKNSQEKSTNKITNSATKPVKKTVSTVEQSSKKVQSTPKQISTVLVLLLAVVAGFFGGYVGGQSNTLSGQDVTTIQREVIDNESNLINKIATDVGPSVVSINVTSVSVGEDFFGFDQEFEQLSAGTGVIISEDGLIITNRHVVPPDTTEVAIVLSDGTEIEGVEVVGRTNQSDPLDIAFLKVKDAAQYDFKPAILGDSDASKIGERVVAIGNALGEFQNTVTSGIISGFGRDIEAFDGNGTEKLQNLIQTDAAINSGNSGGPLVNMAGEVVGINVATASAENISFAMPINDIKPLIDIVLQDGKLERPYLGVRYVTLNEDIAEQLDVSVSQGAYVPEGSIRRPSILPGSPAEQAGIQEGDIIVEIDGQKLDEQNTVVSILGRKRVGDTVTIKVLRDGQEETLQATLQAAPEQ